MSNCSLSVSSSHNRTVSWIGLAAGKDVEALLSTLVQNGFVQAGGLLTTLAADTDQQWDSPNAWAPLVLMTVEGMGALGIPGGFYLAVSV